MRGIASSRRWLFLSLGALFLFPFPLAAQDLFEIQVYPYETVEPHRTMVELHMNYFPAGTKEPEPGLFPVNHQFHFTIEVTRGLSRHWEMGGYLVTAYVPGQGARYAGSRIRPRYRFPETWRLPFRLSISTELAYNAPRFDLNTVTLEVRPILEREMGKWYFSVNPDLTKSFRGVDAHRGLGFEPGVKVSYNVTKRLAPGLEYYAETGPIAHFSPLHDQHHLIFPTLDLNTSPNWELNFAVGRGFTGTSQHWVVKWIIGYRFKF